MSARITSAARPVIRERLWLDDDGKCHYCRVWTLPADGSVDHVVPRAFGGTNNYWNLVFACTACNEKLADSTSKCTCRKCVRAKQRFHKNKLPRSAVELQPKTTVQFVRPRRVQDVAAELATRLERTLRSIEQVGNPDSQHAASMRGRAVGYRHALVLLAAAYDDEIAPEVLIRLDQEVVK